MNMTGGNAPDGSVCSTNPIAQFSIAFNVGLSPDPANVNGDIFSERHPYGISFGNGNTYNYLNGSCVLVNSNISNYVTFASGILSAGGGQTTIYAYGTITVVRIA